MSTRELIERVWASLPPQSREALLQLPAEEFLPKYQELIEEYYRRLAETKEPCDLVIGQVTAPFGTKGEAKVRLEFPNPTGELRPEMFGEVTMQAKERQGLRIPADAVIDSGTKKVVFLALPEGKFQPREVHLGAVAADTVEVLSGLQAGDHVVTRANFLVDSESRLRASLASMGGK